MTNDSKQNNSPNEQPTAKKFSLENLANLSKILASVVSIVSDFLKNDFSLVKTNLFLVFFSKKN